MHILLSQILKEKGNKIYSAAPETNVLECAKMLKDLKIGALMVLDQNKVVGIISERDLVHEIMAHEKDAAQIKAKEIMSHELLTVNPNMTVQEAMKLVTEHRCRHLPVMEDSQLVGLISIGDLTKAVMMELEREISDLTDYIHGNQ